MIMFPLNPTYTLIAFLVGLVIAVVYIYKTFPPDWHDWE